jgi:RND family efflux transporter MFP subunit
MSIFRKLLILPPVLAGVALMIYATSNRQPPAVAAPEERRSAVAHITATPRSFTPRVSGFGAVAPARVWEAVAQVRGRVIYTHPDFVKGGTVRAGDVLVRIAPDDYELAIAQAAASIESAAAAIEEMKLSGTTTERSLEIERKALELAKRELARQRDLAGRGTVAAAVVEAQERAVLTQQAKVQSLENQLALLPVQIKALEQAKAVSESALKIAELDLERTVLTAPFDARVARADVEISQYVGAGTNMGALDGTAAAEIDVQIPPQQMAAFGRLAFEGGARPPDREGRGPVGLTAHVSLGDARGSEGWEAEVRRISDTVDPATRSIGVIVSVPDPYGQFRAGSRPPLIKGMFVRVELRAPPVEDVILLPRAAIREGRAMLVGDDDRLRFADVATDYASGDIAIIRAGDIAPGARIVTSDLSPAVEGMLLAPTRDDAAEARLEAAAGGNGE